MTSIEYGKYFTTIFFKFYGKYHFLSYLLSHGRLSRASFRPFVRPFVRPSVNMQLPPQLPWVPCERNSSYRFVSVFLKLCRCFLHGMGMCMWFGYNCKIIFVAFSTLCEFFRPQYIDSGYLVSATPHTILCRSF